ncbi:MAG: dienelactone hydrolase family protein [Chloroflexi bacterium]|nr:dienelactone hydrolase family protein [Chloroflexota bacterium]
MADVIPRAATVSGVVLERVKYDSSGYEVPAFMAKPAGKGPWPGVIVGQEAFGLTPHVEDIAANLAREGYVAFVPDYYARTGEPVPREDIPAIQAAVDRIHNPSILDDYLNAIKHLERAGLVRGKVGTIGFCTGGTYSMILAIEKPNLACAVLFYVSQLTYPAINERKPYHPIDRAGRIKCPTMVIYGDSDPVGTAEKIARIEANLKAGKVPYALRLYKGGGHAFLNPDGWSYHDDSSRKAWPDALTFLRKHLKG